jgi:hypothetical protein
LYDRAQDLHLGWQKVQQSAGLFPIHIARTRMSNSVQITPTTTSEQNHADMQRKRLPLLLAPPLLRGHMQCARSACAAAPG